MGTNQVAEYGPPNGLVVFAAGVIFLSLFIFVFWGIPALIQRSKQRRRVTSTTAVLPRRDIPAMTVTQPISDNDTRAMTLAAIRALPSRIVMPSADTNRMTMPLLMTPEGWRHLRLDKDGDWGVFGTRGSGKGNALQYVALNALSFGPDTVELVVIDAKGGLDYNFCRRIEHARLYAGSADTITSGLDYLLLVMQHRIGLLAESDARNLPEYERKTGERLPWIVAIYDEIGDFSKAQREKIETLARMGRAEGIIGFYATQYPTAEVLTNQIQANVTNRLVFRITSSEYTRVSLRRQKSDNGTFEPSVIPSDRPGVAVLRSDSGAEVVGRLPEVSDEWRQAMIDQLAARWPKTETDTPDADKLLTGMLAAKPISDPIVDKVAELLDENPSISQNELERIVVGYNGGAATRKIKNALQMLRATTTTH